MAGRASEGPLRVGVLASGAGTNLQALLDRLHGRGAVEIVAVGSDKPGAGALDRAREAGIEARAFTTDEHGSREARDRAIGDWLAERGVGLVVLAGFMQLLDAEFLGRFPQRVINLHPALLPSFPGLDAIGQAWAHGVRYSGVTVHFVDTGMDTGPILLQEPIAIDRGRGIEAFEAEVHRVEHELLPQAVALIASGAVRFDEDNPRLVTVAEDQP